MRVVPVDPDQDEAHAETASPPSERTTLVAEVSDVPLPACTIPVAPPLAVRPVEDAEWVMRN
jgi:hypothetical protein